MNQMQKTYAMNRVNEIAGQRRVKSQNKHTTKTKYLALDKRLSLIRTGKVKLNAKCNAGTNNPSITVAFDFSKYENKGSIDWDKVSKEMEPIEEECLRIKDQIMLGDEAEALKMIIKFEKM